MGLVETMKIISLMCTIITL